MDIRDIRGFGGLVSSPVGLISKPSDSVALACPAAASSFSQAAALSRSPNILAEALASPLLLRTSSPTLYLRRRFCLTRRILRLTSRILWLTLEPPSTSTSSRLSSLETLAEIGFRESVKRFIHFRRHIHPAALGWRSSTTRHI